MSFNDMQKNTGMNEGLLTELNKISSGSSKKSYQDDRFWKPERDKSGNGFAVIFDKIQEKMQPEFDDEDALNPFCMWTGANFKIKIREVAGFVNYDKSEFASSEPLLEGDNGKLEELWKTQYSLQEFVAPDQFKS